MKKEKLVSEMIALIMGFTNDETSINYNYNSSCRSFTVSVLTDNNVEYQQSAYIKNLSSVKEFEIMRDYLKAEMEVLNNQQIERYIKAASKLVGVDISDDLKNQDREYVLGRYLVMYKLRKTTLMTLSKIGTLFGKGHSDVLHGIKAINNLIDTEKNFARDHAEFIF